jgi:hypothetical protein
MLRNYVSEIIEKVLIPGIIVGVTRYLSQVDHLLKKSSAILLNNL